MTKYRIFHRLAAAALGSALLSLAACTPDTPTPIPGTSPSPGGSSSPNPSTSGTPLPVALVSVQLQIQTPSNQVINGAEVRLTSPSQPTQVKNTDASGRVTFSGLRKDTEYSIDVSAAGFEGASRKANPGQLATQGQNELLLGIVLNPVSSTVKGRVLDNSGAPVAGATVFDTRQSVSTDSAGRFTLGYASGGDIRLAVSKTGFQGLSRSITVQANQNQDLGDLTLTRRSGPLRLGFDLSHNSLGSGSSALNAYAGLQSVLTGAGYQLSNIGSDLSNQLDSLDVLMILSPASSFSAEEIGAIEAFVLSGRKLVVTGEWAGFAGFDGGAANQMLAPFKVQFGLDTLRESNSGFLNVASFQSHPVTAGLSALKLYQSGSVLLDGSGELLARTGSDSFQIAANTGSFAVVAAATHGSGKVVVVGDSSLWSGEDSDGNGTANLDEGDNRKLLQQIADW